MPNLVSPYKSKGLNATTKDEFSTMQTQNPNETETGQASNSKGLNVLLDSRSNSLEGNPAEMSDQRYPNGFVRKYSVNGGGYKNPPGTAPQNS